MGQMTTAMVAIFSGLFALGGSLQLAGSPPATEAETGADTGQPEAPTLWR